jgi:hypothetical protein
MEEKSKIEGKDVETNNNKLLENKGTYCFQMLLRNLNLLFEITMEMKIL